MKKTINKSLNNLSYGFTLIELLLVVGILSLLGVAVFVGLNPLQRFKDTRDARRTTDAETILSAVHSYIIDNGGSLPSGLSVGMSETQLGTAASGCTVSTGGCSVAATACLDLSTPLADYLTSMPKDPNGGTAAETNYSIVVNSSGLVTIKACGTEGSTNISASR